MPRLPDNLRARETLCCRAPPGSIQQSAALALGRLANYSDELAEALVQNEILPQLVCGVLCARLSARVRLAMIACVQEGRGAFACTGLLLSAHMNAHPTAAAWQAYSLALTVHLHFACHPACCLRSGVLACRAEPLLQKGGRLLPACSRQVSQSHASP